MATLVKNMNVYTFDSAISYIDSILDVYKHTHLKITCIQSDTLQQVNKLWAVTIPKDGSSFCAFIRTSPS